VYGHLNLFYSLANGALYIQIPNYAAGHGIIMLFLIVL